jgi:prevent-host-death family protein
MVNVGSFDAKTHLPALLKRVSKGETVQITRRGIPVARLVPAEQEPSRNPKEAVRRIRELRRGLSLGKLTIRGLIREGRRF